MTVVRIEHTVLDYGRWKQAFDDDPIGRQRSGVRAYRILRGADDPNDVLIDLELRHGRPGSKLSSIRSSVIWGRVHGRSDRRAERPDRRIRGSGRVLTARLRGLNRPPDRIGYLKRNRGFPGRA